MISFSNGTLAAQQHPNLTLTKVGLELIQEEMNNVPLFKETLKQVQRKVDKEIESGVIVPVPKDMAGGYTHEQHKKNFFTLQSAGNLYQITGDKKYAEHIKESLLAYAKLYPTLPIHPTNKSYATGKIFWQCLNDANWLVYVSQAYDCIYDYLSSDERAYIEKDLFIPFAEFLSIGNPKFFNRIHNHSTWANAAVGMIGLVMGNEKFVEQALYGLKNDGIDLKAIDNDGGYIKKDGVRQAGFLAQLDYSFGPEGYFVEGPYYLRYAIFPFLVFSKALQNHKPELDIFEYRNSILDKAVNTLLQLTDPQGNFFPINDALKGMSWEARELVTAVDLMYSYRGQNPELLDIAKKQNKVLLDGSGFKVARALQQGKSEKFNHKSIVFKDVEEGTSSGVGVLRSDNTNLVFKYSSQGMGHGHFDRLAYSLYDERGEIIQDYGAVRWVNVDQKGGGRYLPENRTFGKQSIGHNTLVVGEESHFDGRVKDGENSKPQLFFTELDNTDIKLISAKENKAYPGVNMQRTMCILTDNLLPNPIIIDVLRASSDSNKQYDVPVWYNGHLIDTNVDYIRNLKEQKTLGKNNGYQHIWKEAEGSVSDNNAFITWMGNNKFYTITSVNKENDQYVFGRLGANDPNFNLRSEPVFIHRRNAIDCTSFVSIIESHGKYDRVTEIPENPFSEIKSVTVIKEDCDYIIMRIGHLSDTYWTLALANNENDRHKNHKVKTQGQELSWNGPYLLTKNKL